MMSAILLKSLLGYAPNFLMLNEPILYAILISSTLHIYILPLTFQPHIDALTEHLRFHLPTGVVVRGDTRGGETVQYRLDGRAAVMELHPPQSGWRRER